MSAASPALADSHSNDCGGGDKGGVKAADDGGGDSGNCGGDCGGSSGSRVSGVKAADDGGGDCGGNCGGSDNSGGFNASDEGGGDEGNCEDDTATASVTFTDPSCANQNAVDYNGTGSTGVTFSVQSGTVAAGQSVVIRATAPSHVEFADESKTMDFPHTFGDAVNLEGPPCVTPPQTVVPVDPTFTDPTCNTAGSVTLPTAVVIPGRKATGPVLETKDVNGVHYVVTGSLAAGGTVDVDASAIAPAVLADGATTHFSHTFTTPTGCTTVSPPPPTDVDGVTVTTPTLVHAGLVGSIKAPDLRSEQGLALIVAGMVMLMGAGGLGLRTAKKNS